MYKRFVKRLLDIIISLCALIILSPLLLILWILVRIKLGKPALFAQARPGKDGKIFKLHKFRSMTDERDQPGRAAGAFQHLEGRYEPHWAKAPSGKIPALVLGGGKPQA